MVAVPSTILGGSSMSDPQETPVRLGGKGYSPPPGSPGPPAAPVSNVTVVGFDMPFLNLVGFFIKAALAAVPAAIIVGIIWALLAAVLFGGVAGLVGRHA
jgi:hypothetical protein